MTAQLSLAALAVQAARDYGPKHAIEIARFMTSPDVTLAAAHAGIAAAVDAGDLENRHGIVMPADRDYTPSLHVTDAGRRRRVEQHGEVS